MKNHNKTLQEVQDVKLLKEKELKLDSMKIKNDSINKTKRKYTKKPTHCSFCGHILRNGKFLIEWTYEGTRKDIEFSSQCDDCNCGSCGSRKFPGKICC
tara:strand:- start:281 stop:577 length:297 start_codon:yes stop_codon:yes gene_type:complete